MHKSHKKYPGIYKLLIVLAVLIVYLVIASLQFGVRSGILVTMLSWSFFVFCTPIADAGFLLDLPIRIITGFKMLYTEAGVWVFAATLNIVMLTFEPEIYTKTPLLKLFHTIIFTPWPLWLIIVLSAIGTFVSIYLGDNGFDIIISKRKLTTYQRDKLRIYLSVVVYVLTIGLYLFLLKVSGVHF